MFWLGVAVGVVATLLVAWLVSLSGPEKPRCQRLYGFDRCVFDAGHDGPHRCEVPVAWSQFGGNINQTIWWECR